MANLTTLEKQVLEKLFQMGSESEMRGLEWGRLYEEYHNKKYNSAKVSAEVRKLYGDPYIKNRKGIFEYIFGGSTDTKLLELRVFEEPIKRPVYEKQTAMAKTRGKSNCPDCAIGHDANRAKIWNYSEMEADHVAAWSKGGKTDIKNESRPDGAGGFIRGYIVIFKENFEEFQRTLRRS
jgi:hypothetical protein